MQAVVEGAEDPEASLQAAGLYFNGGAIAWLTPAQKSALFAELEDMEVRPWVSHACIVLTCMGAPVWMYDSAALQIMSLLHNDY